MQTNLEKKPLKILVSCLEASANLHFKEVLKELEKDYQITLLGIFDSKIAKPYMDSKEFSAMGFVEVVPLIFKAKKAIKKMVELARDCDAILLVDSPAFNLPLAKAIKSAGIKTPITYYILPQVWAWKEKRVAKVEKYCDNLASILPFDDRYYSKSTYVGHPLLDELKGYENSTQNSQNIVFLPGSRVSEIKRLMPIFKEVASSLKDKNLILVVPPNLKDKIDEFYGDIGEFEVNFNTPEILSKCEFAFICSGTATLEAAIIGVPFVLCYKAKALDIAIAKRFLKIRYVGLANIIFDFMQRPLLHKELIQDEVSAKNLLDEYQNCDRAKFSLAKDELKNYLKFGSAKNVADMLSRGAF